MEVKRIPQVRNNDEYLEVDQTFTLACDKSPAIRPYPTVPHV